MILRLFTLLGVVTVVGALYLVLPQGIGPGAFQIAPDKSSMIGYVEAGLFPDPKSLSENEEVGHGVFEEPAEDEVRIAAAREAMGTMSGMGGMQMGGDEPMDMAEDGAASVNEEQTTQAADNDMAAMPGMNNDAVDSASTPAAAPMEMATEQPSQPADGSMAAMPGMNDDAADSAAAPVDAPMEMATEQTTQPIDDSMAAMPGMNDDTADSPSTPADAPMAMATEQTPQPTDNGMAAMPGMGVKVEENHDVEAETAGDDGLVILAADASFDRKVEISMREWGYSLSQLEVQPGERIRLNIRNDGNIPHEFMFMPMANMQAIAYRLERADWNLLEHAAPYERSLVLPGQSFEVTMRIAEPGAWMFMCMFPYHMQFGMMGQMATPGLSMAM
ncbi:multicopper oxidase domain-containing protein [Aurantimonas sp. E1-2-R+4]|uniref:multicopper oxidase domain-containing protein n=1 Tax=Aurantimonas sp. E1-2-R+4 TaxID=3113714 RepID=UPI002F93425E